MFKSYEESFPQFELSVKTWGGYGFQSLHCIYFRGYGFTPEYKGDRGEFYLELLNKLKKGQYEKKITDLAKNSLSEEEWKIVSCVFKNKNPKLGLLDKQLKEAQIEIEKLKTETSQLQNIISENNSLKENLQKIKDIVSEI